MFEIERCQNYKNSLYISQIMIFFILVHLQCQYIFVHDALLDYMRSNGPTIIPSDALETIVNSKEFFDQIEHQWKVRQLYFSFNYFMWNSVIVIVWYHKKYTFLWRYKEEGSPIWSRRRKEIVAVVAIS